MKVALTHDWLTGFGGAERVLGELLRVFPGAPIHTTVHDPDALPPAMREWDVRTSFLQRVPFARRHYRAFLPLMPFAWEAFDFSGYDVVLTTASACAKGVIVPPGTRTLCYCYTPPRYLWDQYHEQTRHVRGKPLVALAAHWLRLWDRAAADRIDHFVAISHTVKERIRRYYRREAEVIYPPVDTGTFVPNGRDPEDFLLVVGRMVPYKRLDLAVAAATRLGLPLRVVGDGPERRRLEAAAGPTVRFLGRLPDTEIAGLYARARAFIFPGMDDFGITPVEAQAAGRPVVAYGRGGALETVVDGATGVFFEEQTVDALAAAIERAWGTAFDPAVCRANAERFDSATFRHNIARVVGQWAPPPTAARPPAPGPRAVAPLAS